MSEELEVEPCPFCGHRAMGPHRNSADPESLWWISCTNCQAEMSASRKRADIVVTMWNTRTPTVATDEPWFGKAIRDHCDEHGPSGGAWNISMILERLHSARAAIAAAQVEVTGAMIEAGIHAKNNHPVIFADTIREGDAQHVTMIYEAMRRAAHQTAEQLK